MGFNGHRTGASGQELCKAAEEQATTNSSLTRAFVAEIRIEKLAEYKGLHAAPWPEIVELLHAANLEDYWIWLDESRGLLFSSWTYRGNNLETDFARMRNNPLAKAWHEATLACLMPIGDGTDAWHTIDPIFCLASPAASKATFSAGKDEFDD